MGKAGLERLNKENAPPRAKKEKVGGLRCGGCGRYDLPTYIDEGALCNQCGGTFEAVTLFAPEPFKRAKDIIKLADQLYERAADVTALDETDRTTHGERFIAEMELIKAHDAYARLRGIGQEQGND